VSQGECHSGDLIYHDGVSAASVIRVGEFASTAKFRRGGLKRVLYAYCILMKC
jgi:hypothetical protein